LFEHLSLYFFYFSTILYRFRYIDQIKYNFFYI